MYISILPPLSPTQQHVLELLDDSSRELYAAEMIRKSKELEGAIILKRGTIYETLRRLKRKEFVTSRKVDEDRQDEGTIHLYSLTEYGKKVLQVWQISAQSRLAAGI